MITSLPSRYRDPDTSLPFANAYAHKEIQHAVEQRYAWSAMLGCYVGPAATAARGVPERFLSSGQNSGSGGSSGDGAQSTPVESDKGRAEGGS